MNDLLNNIVKANEAFGKINEGDYYDENGRLFCGKCNKPKQTEKPILINGKLERRFVPCRCDEEEEKRFNERIDEQKLQDKIKTLRRLGVLDEAYINYTFENDDKRNTDLTDRCKKYVEHWNEMASLPCGVLLYGDVGGGKSYLAGCIVNALLSKGVPALITRLSYLVNNRIDKNTPNINLGQFKLIVLDDIGTENASQTAFDIVNDIYLLNIPIICTTNLTLSELKQPKDNNHKATYDRILQRCGQKWCVPVTKSRIDISRELGHKSTDILSK